MCDISNQISNKCLYKEDLNMSELPSSIIYEYGNPDEEDFMNLTDEANLFIMVPCELIIDTETNQLRIALYSYFYIHRGLNNKMYVSITELLRWMNKQPNMHKGGINYRVLDGVKYLKQTGYINYDDSIFSEKRRGPANGIWHQFFEVKFMDKFVKEKIKEYPFTCIYYDEILKILNNRDENKQDKYAKNTQTLLLFSYLKWKIGKRPNKISESMNSKTYIEAYDCCYDDIKDDIGLKNSMISECVKILDELDLIKHEKVSRRIYSNYKSKNSVGFISTVIFVNTYKREGRLLLASGEDYYLKEIQKKKEKLKYIS